MKLTRTLATQPRRDAWVDINLWALEHNARKIRAALPLDIRLMAILKADAYGHGAVMTLPTLEAAGVSMVGVASMDEAIQIREAGIELPILVIGGIPSWSVGVAAEQEIQLTVFSDTHLASLAQAYSGTGQTVPRPVKVHVKVDTGMHRIGVPIAEAADFIRRCRQTPGVEVAGVFSHLAAAEDPIITQAQVLRWKALLSDIAPLPAYYHLANTVGALAPNNRPLLTPDVCNLVRIGIAFFGYGADNLVQALDLKPTMGLRARIVHLQEVPAGTGISYHHRFITERPSRIATLPLGYADGVPRALSGKIHGLLRGQKVPQVGVITMDQLMLDVTDVPDAAVGEAVTLLGQEGQESITLTDWARWANTIEYELMCGLRVRLARTYSREPYNREVG